MAQAYPSPGVYRQESFPKPSPVLQTGVPGVVGFAGAPPGATLLTNQPVALNRKEEFNASFSSANSFLADAITGFFENGGTRCYVVAADDSIDPVQGLVIAIAALAPLDGVDLVAVPDAARLLKA